MCHIVNQFLVSEMEAEVARRMAAGTAFTALDVSRAVQASGVRERHRSLKSAVHEMYERGDMAGYTRDLVRLPTGETPFLYRPDTARSSVNRFAIAVNAPNRAAATVRVSRAVGNVRALDAWRRLRIPARALRDAGLAPGDTVYACTKDDGTVRLSSSRPAPDAPDDARPYRVDRYNIVRLTLKVTTAYFKVEATAQGRVEASPQ